MFCLNCGKELSDDAVFCGYCGHRTDAPAAATQETVIVPEIPGEPAVPGGTPVDRPTVIVPEIPLNTPEPDPLDDMYADKPERGNLIGLIIGLIAAAMVLTSVIIVVVLGAMNNWWRQEPADEETKPTTAPTASVDPEGTKPGGDADQPTTPDPNKKLVEHSFDGLRLYLGEEFTAVTGGAGDGFMSPDAQLTVIHGWLTAEEKTAEDYADAYVQRQTGIKKLSAESRSGVPYRIITYKDKSVRYVGFYEREGYGWTVEIYTDTYDDTNEEFIGYVTGCKLDKSFQLPDKVELKEFDFAGLYLNMDSTFVSAVLDNRIVFSAAGMDLEIMLTPLSDLDDDTSKAYAEAYYQEMQTMTWKNIELRTRDNNFYYVLMITPNGKVVVEGLYTYGQTGWVISGETREDNNGTMLLENYITSGRIEPDEVPTLEGSLDSVTLNGLTLPLEKGYRESYRGDYVMLSKGTSQIYIFTDRLSDLGQFTSAYEIAMADYEANLFLWDNVRLYTINGVDCLMTWDNTDTTITNAFGYYVWDNYYWKVQISMTGEPDEDALLAMVSSATVDPAAIDDLFYEDIEMINRDRIEMTGQATDVFEGLQYSYSPDWVRETAGLVGGGFTMTVNHMEQADMVTAEEYALAAARALSASWDYCEIGLAGDVYYALVSNDGGALEVYGFYTDDANFWEIHIFCTDSTQMEQAIWYATSGVIQ